jgi:hypothetical protein
VINSRDRQLARVSSAIGDRSLLFFGIRGDDAAPLLRLARFQHCYSVAAPLNSLSLTSVESLETLTGRRVDLDAYDIDDDKRPVVDDFRRSLMSRLNKPSLVVDYRPSHFLSNIAFAMHETTRALGMFKDRQSAYEYKPWVETEVARLGVRTIGWQYVADEYRQRATAALERGPIVLRVSRSSGGVGIELVTTPEQLELAWPRGRDHLVAVGPYLADAIPLNVGGVVHDPSTVTVHPGSVQLIGVPECTNRQFGYCGNDMAAFTNLGARRIEQVDDAVRTIGMWLGREGYRGAFGVDFLLDGEILYFAEVNARLQGSTALGSTLAMQSEHVDIVVDHLSALLGVGPVERLTLNDWCDETPPASHMVVHNLLDTPVTLSKPKGLWSLSSSGFDAQLAPARGTAVEPGAILVRLVGDRAITDNGFDLAEIASRAAATASGAFSAAGPDEVEDGDVHN